MRMTEVGTQNAIALGRKPEAPLEVDFTSVLRVNCLPLAPWRFFLTSLPWSSLLTPMGHRMGQPTQDQAGAKRPCIIYAKPYIYEFVLAGAVRIRTYPVTRYQKHRCPYHCTRPTWGRLL